MIFHRPHSRKKRTCEESKTKLEKDNYHLRNVLQTDVENNCLNEKRFNQLEREYSQYEQEIQDLNKDIKRLENALEEEIAELKFEILSLKNQLYQAKKDVLYLQNQGVNSADNAGGPPTGREVVIGYLRG
ncbi:19891_t:CDS:2, partial [Funneliformis geosporum]